MFKLESLDIIRITPGMAKGFQNLDPLEYQRKMQQYHVSNLVRKMEKGLFRIGEIAIAKFNGRQYLINGQHQIEAVILSGMEIPATQEIYICENEKDLSQLFRQFDVNPMRPFPVIVKAEILAMNLGWSTRVGVLLVGAINWMEGRGKHISRDEKVEVLRHYTDVGNYLNILIPETSVGKMLRRMPVVAAMMETRKVSNKEPSIAHNFWIMVRDGEGLTKDMGAYTLRDYLLNLNMKFGFPIRKPTVKEIISKCIHGWNAHIRGVSTRLAYHHQAPMPKAIAPV